MIVHLASIPIVILQDGWIVMEFDEYYQYLHMDLDAPDWDWSRD